MYTTAEAAQRLNLSEVRVRKLCQEGRLGRKVGQQWIITEAQLQRFARKPRFSGRPAKDDHPAGGR